MSLFFSAHSLTYAVLNTFAHVSENWIYHVFKTEIWLVSKEPCSIVVNNVVVITEGEWEDGTNWESSSETYTLLYVKLHGQWEFVEDTGSSNGMLCDNLEGWHGVGGGGKVQEGGTYVFLKLIHVNVWQKPTQYCKAIIFQLKINEFKNNVAYLIMILPRWC